MSIKPALELEIGSPAQQFHFAPLNMREGKGFLAVYSDCRGIDPWPPYFELPTDTLKLTAFGPTGRRLWHRDLGAGVIPGVWFCPVFTFDLDGDGDDEVFLVNNGAPEHPLDVGKCVLERLSARSGETIGSYPWPKVSGNQPLSHLWRNFINAGFSKGDRRLITAQGTYGPMQLQCWDADFRQVWSRRIEPGGFGSAGSHMFPIIDIDGDGRDELLWGERCIDIDTGQDIWLADPASWQGHSDVVMPTLDLKTGHWLIYTCREQPSPLAAIGVVMFDDSGNKLWGHYGMGHVHDGWTARLNDDGSHLCYALDVGRDKYSKSDVYLYDLKGNPVDLPFSPLETVPVDFDGDGLHELMYTGGQNVGCVVDRHGQEVCHLEGSPAYAGKLLDAPGEQIVTWPEGQGPDVIRIYACPGAQDTPAARRRYDHPYYAACMRIWAVGYNRRNLGGL